MRDRGLRFWLPAYLAQLPKMLSSRRVPTDKTVHLMFVICDHFEPKHAATYPGHDDERMAVWEQDYPAFHQRIAEKYGHGPKHTWFYPPHHGEKNLPKLSQFAFSGRYGEVEFHYHHEDDTSASLRADLQQALTTFNHYGLLLASGEKPERRFAFIHGDWALDNSHPDGAFCGVNDEFDILSELGCWGDFTMPSANECQTRKINSIYYTRENPHKAKSHDSGTDLRVNGSASGFFMMQGPLGIYFSANTYPRMENAALSTKNWGRPERIRTWIRHAAIVQGKPEWRFLKLHCHGAVNKDFDALFGERAYAMHQHLNERYNDGHKFKLHYVTAREAYNIAKAAEAGLEGDPDNYRDYLIPAPTTQYYALNVPHNVTSCSDNKLCLQLMHGQTQERKISLNYGVELTVDGYFERLSVVAQQDQYVMEFGGCRERLQVVGGIEKLMVISGQRSDAGDSARLSPLPQSDVIQFAINK